MYRSMDEADPGISAGALDQLAGVVFGPDSLVLSEVAFWAERKGATHSDCRCEARERLGG